MKPIALIFSILAFLAFNSYSQDKDVKQLLNNQETRTAIFNAIADNHELMNGFMEVAKGNQHTMTMMQKNGQMSGEKGKMEMTHAQMNMQHNHQMMGRDNMMDMCKQDSAMCSNRADSPETMEMCMKMTSEKKEMNTNSSVLGKESEQKAKNNTNRPRYRHR